MPYASKITFGKVIAGRRVINIVESEARDTDVSTFIALGVVDWQLIRFRSELISGTGGTTIQSLLSTDGTSTAGNNVIFEVAADSSIDEIKSPAGWPMDTPLRGFHLHSRVNSVTPDHVIETIIMVKNTGW